MDSGFLISTSRKPSVLTRRLVRWLVLLLGGLSVNRGKQNISQLATNAKTKGFRYMIVVHESHSNPSQLAFFDADLSLAVANISVSNIPDVNSLSQRIPKNLNHILKSNGEMESHLLKMFENVYDSANPSAKYDLSIIAENKILSFEIEGKSIGPQIKLNSFVEFSMPEEVEQ